MKKLIVLTAFVSLMVYSASAQTKIAAKDATKHLNETVTISDKVYSTKLIENTNMVLLDLGGEHPNQYLTVVIKGEDRAKFNSKPEEYYKGREVTVTGKLIDYRGKPEIIVGSADDLKLSLNDNIIKQPLKTGN
jgi:DNA/RNA endonuclease YhcR with UshA esterase domain